MTALPGNGVTFRGDRLPLATSIFAILALSACEIGIAIVFDLCLNPRWSAECRSVEPPRPFEFTAEPGEPCPEFSGAEAPEDGGLRIGERFLAGVAGTDCERVCVAAISMGDASRMVASDVRVTDREREVR